MSDGEKTGFLSRLFGRGKGEDKGQDKGQETDSRSGERTETKEATPPLSPEAQELQQLREEVAEEVAEEEARLGQAHQTAAEHAAEADSERSDATEAALEAMPADTMPLEADPEASKTSTPEPSQPEPLPPLRPAPDPHPAADVHPSAPAPAASQPAEPAKPRGFFARLTQGLTRSSAALTSGITDVFAKRKLDASTLEELEDVLVQADLGVETAMKVAEAVGEGRYGREIAPDEVKAILAAEVSRVLDPVARPMPLDPSLKPQIVLVVGVNGSGKTTTIGKLASKFTARGKTVMLAAGDTVRAAAVEQLKVWGERTGAPVITRPHGADAASLAFDAVKEAKAAGTDVLMIDTAGRLQNKTELMAELEKVVRVIKKIDPKAPHTVLLVLDATVGQNAMSQVEVFKRSAGVTGLAMTKLDGTAKGGILVAIAAKHRLPIHFIGVGEGIDDLEPFDPDEFAAAIAGV
ncbi:MAG: signal recognition particle-docking protein FtsY [Pseudomonadota bacterium]